MTAYFVTGATGFIGRHLVERLLEREGDIHVLVREGSREKLDKLIERGASAGPDQAGGRRSRRGAARRRATSSRARSTTSSTSPRSTTWAPTRRATRCSTSAGPRTRSTSPTRSRSARFHHMSSIAVAGHYDDGTFNEDMFDEGQKLAHPYHRTKFESEKLVRERVKSPWRVYRPSVVVGDSRTGEMDKVDGPYYFFKLIQKIRHTLPEWFPLISLEWGWTNIVPVDYVAAVVDHIAHQDGPRRPGLPRRRPQGPARRRGAEHVRGGRARAQGRDADRQARDAEPAQGRAQLRDEAARAQADPRAGAGRPRDPRRGRRLHRAELPLRRA